jgi:hypothetical protein
LIENKQRSEEGGERKSFPEDILKWERGDGLWDPQGNLCVARNLIHCYRKEGKPWAQILIVVNLVESEKKFFSGCFYSFIEIEAEDY